MVCIHDWHFPLSIWPKKPDGSRFLLHVICSLPMTVQVITLVESHAIFREKKAGKSFGFKKRICLEQLLSEKPINFQSIITSQNCNKEFKKKLLSQVWAIMEMNLSYLSNFIHFFLAIFSRVKENFSKPV